MLSKKEFITNMQQNEQLQKFLFIRGFLITTKRIGNLDDFPFYGNWEYEQHQNWHFLAHKLTGMHIFETADGKIFFIMGHAYNPFTMEEKEQDILTYIAESHGTEDYIDRINELTGVFVMGTVINNNISFLVDSSGMQSACYGKIHNDFYISSHPQLIGDICGLKMDSFVKELINYKWYGRVMGPYLPADMTPFSEVKRIIPSIEYSYNGMVSHRRFWPLKSFNTVYGKEYERVIEEAGNILKNNMILITKKWKNPWISLTGGIDSNTTFAAANGMYDKFETFSYISAEKEIRDADAAEKIAKTFHVKHHVYHIPDNNDEIEKYDLKVEIQQHNSGYIAVRKENESRKRFYLEENCCCDVEVKSWVSETIRGYWYKHYGRKIMPNLSPKLYRNLYKIFILNRGLAHKIDKVFAEYIREYEYEKIPDCYPAADMHYNEVTWGSWGGLNISEMKYCFDITFVYNNRKFLDLMFRVPLEKRISDEHHIDVKKYLNKELYDLNIRVVNMAETVFRAKMLNIIFTINSLLPF